MFLMSFSFWENLANLYVGAPLLRIQDPLLLATYPSIVQFSPCQPLKCGFFIHSIQSIVIAMMSCRGRCLTWTRSWTPGSVCSGAPGTGWGAAGPARRAPCTIQHGPRYPAPEVRAYSHRVKAEKIKV